MHKTSREYDTKRKRQTDTKQSNTKATPIKDKQSRTYKKMQKQKRHDKKD